MSTTVTNTVDIKADPDDVWAVLADLPATRWWLPGVVAARVDGDVRVCTMADGQEIRAHYVVNNTDPNMTFGKLMQPADVPAAARRKLARTK